MAASRRIPTFTTGMLVCWLLFATVPLWIGRIGLYQYLGIEILIFAIYALAFNLVLGHAGLPSFGHGAFFGIGAYASASRNSICFPICGFASLSPFWPRALRERSSRFSFLTGAASTTR
jgi:branched-chain amino acid transport system permease protein